MPLSTAYVTTDRPERYIKQLVSHLGHKADGELTGDGRGSIGLSDGDCVLRPAGDRLKMVAAAKDAEALGRVQDVITRHLQRFGDRDELSVVWSSPVAGDALQIVDPVAEDYLLANCTPADELLQELAAVTREATGDRAGMQITQDSGALLTLLVRMTGARRAIELGVFTGYSSLCIARALPEDGSLLACDVSEEWTSIARRFWERAGVAGRIDLKIGPALETLRALPAEPAFDIAFVDADKVNYPAYYEEIVPRLGSGGLIVLDNVFLGGRVFDPAFQEEHHQAMRRVNETIVQDDRVESVMLPLRDGVTLARKR